MNVEELAALVIDACEAEGIEHMVTGAFATGFYGIPRSTKDVDVVLSLAGGSAIECMMARLDPHVAFDPRIQFDTLTWGRRQVGNGRRGSCAVGTVASSATGSAGCLRAAT
jgi:hypothetical protein